MASVHSRHIRCAHRNKKVKVAPHGRVPTFCSNNCRRAPSSATRAARRCRPRTVNV